MLLGGIPIGREAWGSDDAGASNEPKGPVSHSDGDAVLHALTDAILAALGEPDLGTLFPDTDPGLDGADSARFLDEAVSRMRSNGFRIGNADITVICERPRLGPLRDAIRRHLAGRLDAEVNQVNIKGKSHEGVDAIGEGRAIEVHAVVLLVK